MFPDTVAVPVDIVKKLVRLSLPVTSIVIEAQVKVPAPTARVLSSPEPVPEFIVIAPVTANEFVPEMETVVAVPPALIVKLAQVAAVLTVTLTPLLIITSSVAEGTPTGDHVAGVFQLPLATAVFCAFTIVAVIISSTTIANAFVPCKIFFMPRVFKFKKGSKLVWLTTEEGYKSLYEEIGNWLYNNVYRQQVAVNNTSLNK